MRQNRSEGRKLFFAAFSLTLVLLAMVMVITVLAVQPAMPQNDMVQQQEYTYRPSASDSLTLLVIGLREKEAQEFLLIRFNPQHGQIPLSLLSADTLVLTESGEQTLTQVYASGGGSSVKKALSMRLQIEIDRYAALPRDIFVRIAAKTGTVSYALPYDIAYTRDGYSINLPAGQRRLDGQDVADVFGYAALQKSPAQRSELLGGLCAAIVNQNLEAASDKKASGLFKFAINLVKTDLSSQDFELRREAMDFVSQIDAAVAGSIPITGEAKAGGFALDEAYVARMQQFFSALS